MNENEIVSPETEKENLKDSAVVGFYDIVETLAKVTVFVMLLFAFVVRLNIVSGHSMDVTLYGGEEVGYNQYKGGDWLLVSDLFYEPTRGDIVILHDTTIPYSDPLVKRVIAVGGQTIELDEINHVLKVDGVVVDESEYVHYEGVDMVHSGLSFPLTLDENEVFVMGDNRNRSADSRIFGPVDKRCVVGKAYMRVFPFNKLTVFKNPFNK